MAQLVGPVALGRLVLGWYQRVNNCSVVILVLLTRKEPTMIISIGKPCIFSVQQVPWY